jgi:hypothetical protein
LRAKTLCFCISILLQIVEAVPCRLEITMHPTAIELGP